MRGQVYTREDTGRGPLILVNASHPLPPQPTPRLAPALPGQDGVLLERRAARMLTACVRAAGAQGKIVAVSGWRSREEQRQIWDDSMRENGEAFTKSYVALPGCSEHETGLAIDLAAASPSIDFIRPDFPRDGVCGEFRRLAPFFGWIERYPAGKEAVTGIACEPWHFRYVGTPHAQIMTERGLCLEEYLELLREGGLRIAYRGGAVRIFRIGCGKDGVTLPLAVRFTVSGDNDGGFLLTVREEIA